MQYLYSIIIHCFFTYIHLALAKKSLSLTLNTAKFRGISPDSLSDVIRTTKAASNHWSNLFALQIYKCKQTPESSFVSGHTTKQTAVK